MKAVVYTGDNSAEYTDVDSPVLQDGQTRVGLSFCGIETVVSHMLGV